MTPEAKSNGAHKVETALSVCAFIAAIALGVEFLHVYWTSHDTMLMGWTFALSLALFAAAFVLWAHSTSIRKDAIGPREPHASPPEDRQAVFEGFYAPGQTGARRNFLVGLGATCVAFLLAIVVSFFRSFAQPPGPSLFGQVWKRGDRLMALNGGAVGVNALRPGSAVIVFPEGQAGSVHAQTILLRVEPQLLRLPPGRADWAPLGYVAYSRVCTHAACPVGEYQKESNLLLCPCHQSTFSVLEGGRPTGGPAARALSQLPLYAGDDGLLHAAGDFDRPPGPGFWRYP